MEIKKHLGKISNLGTRVMVIFRELPDDSEYCLVTEYERLPDFYKDNLEAVISSREAQGAQDLSQILTRTMFGDGEQMLNKLHQMGYLTKVETDRIDMEISANQSIKLSDLNKMINEQNIQPNTNPAVLSPEESAALLEESAANPVAPPAEAVTFDDPFATSDPLTAPENVATINKAEAELTDPNQLIGEIDDSISAMLKRADELVAKAKLLEEKRNQLSDTTQQPAMPVMPENEVVGESEVPKTAKKAKKNSKK